MFYQILNLIFWINAFFVKFILQISQLPNISHEWLCIENEPSISVFRGHKSHLVLMISFRGIKEGVRWRDLFAVLKMGDLGFTRVPFGMVGSND